MEEEELQNAKDNSLIRDGSTSTKNPWSRETSKKLSNQKIIINIFSKKTIKWIISLILLLLY